jgi:hypothetical protein
MVGDTVAILLLDTVNSLSVNISNQWLAMLYRLISKQWLAMLWLSFFLLLDTVNSLSADNQTMVSDAVAVL